jgi:hypothetical protein
MTCYTRLYASISEGSIAYINVSLHWTKLRAVTASQGSGWKDGVTIAIHISLRVWSSANLDRDTLYFLRSIRTYAAIGPQLGHDQFQLQTVYCRRYRKCRKTKHETGFHYFSSWITNDWNSDSLTLTANPLSIRHCLACCVVPCACDKFISSALVERGHRTGNRNMSWTCHMSGNLFRDLWTKQKQKEISFITCILHSQFLYCDHGNWHGSATGSVWTNETWSKGPQRRTFRKCGENEKDKNEAVP